MPNNPISASQLKATNDSRNMNQKQKEDSDQKDSFFALLAAKLGLTEEQAERQHKSFILKYPRGFVTKDQYLKASVDILGQNSILAKPLFAIFDDDKDGKLNAEEFLFAINLSNSCSAEAKLSCIFNMFDTKNEGVIRKVDIRKIIVSLFRIGCLAVDQKITSGCVDDIMETLTKNGNGYVTKNEFVENAMKNSILKNMPMKT